MERPAGRRAAPWLFVALIVVVVGGGIWVWEDVLEDRLIPKRWGTVIEGQVFRSGHLHPALVERTLRKHDIDLVVSLIDPNSANEKDRRYAEAEQEACAAIGLVRRVFPLNGDGTGDIESYVQAIAAIREGLDQGKTVLVHCAAGSQRTGGVFALYRVLVEGWSPADARREMARYDWDPHEDRAVLDHLNANMSQLARRLVEVGVIDALPDSLPRL